MPLSLPEFVERWKVSTLTERAAAQSHFIDLCEVLRQPHPAAADQTGEIFAFEKHVSKLKGGKGFADVWKPPGASLGDLKKRTLTNLYNARPAWLADAHRKLDEAVFAAYGWPATLTDAEILERLLALNHQRAEAQHKKAD